MTVEGKALFETLAPPPGGVAVLRRRLQRERPRQRMRLAALGVGATLAIAGLLVAAQVRTARKQLPIPAEPHPALVRLGLQHPPREPAAIPRRMRHRMALQRVPLETDRVVFYYVAVLPAPSEPHR